MPFFRYNISKKLLPAYKQLMDVENSADKIDWAQ